MTNPEQFLKVTIDGQPLGVPLHRVSSLIRADNVQYSPSKLGPFGWLLNPEEVAIWQLHRLYGVEPPRVDGSPCIRFQGDVSGALLVDEIQGKMEAHAEHRFPILPMAAASRKPLIAEIAVVDDRAIPILNPDALGTVDASTVAARVPEAAPGANSSGLRTSFSPLLAEPTQSPSEGEKALRLSIAAEVALTLPLSQIRAVSPAITSVRIPASPDIVLGVVAWDGEVAYWVDWSRILGNPGNFTPVDSSRWIIAASRQGHLFVFSVDSAMAVMDTDTPLELIDVTDFPYPSVIPAGALFQGRLLVFPDLDALATLLRQE